MNYNDNDEDLNLDDAMFLDRMSHLQVQIDEKIQIVIDNLAQELFEANQDDTLLARIQVLDVPGEKSKKHVMVDDKLHGLLNTHIDMTSDFPIVSVQFEKAAVNVGDIQIRQTRKGFFGFMRGKASL